MKHLGLEDLEPSRKGSSGSWSNRSKSMISAFGTTPCYFTDAKKGISELSYLEGFYLAANGTPS